MTQRVYSLQSTVFRKSSLRCISVHGSRFTVHGDSGILQSSAFRSRGNCRASVHRSRFAVRSDSVVLQSSAFSLQPSEDNACCP